MTTTLTSLRHERRRRSVRYCRATRPAPTRKNTILLGDAATLLGSLPPASVDSVITSPPYFLLRDYGASGQLGGEASIEGWVANLRAVFDQLARVLAPHGSVWLNLGDSYSRHARYGAPRKSMLLGPERLLLALSGDGWIVRNKVVWAKSNPMPASVADRLTPTWEPMYFLVRSSDYYFDLDGIRVPHLSRHQPTRGSGQAKYRQGVAPWAGPFAGANDGLLRARAEGRTGHPLGKNPGDVWTHATAAYRGAHFATFPERLIERPLLASCPERVCLGCGRPWTPVLGRTPKPGCDCNARWRRGVVLDPFMGSGTVALVARRNRRDWLGVELSPAYHSLALRRLRESHL